jgi:hypothetical protein
MDGILITLKNLSFAQMVCAWLFVACYALALGGMLSAKGSLRAGGVALIAAALFSAFSDDWVHGALLVLFAVAGMGLFVAASWALTFGSAWLLEHGKRQPVASPAPRIEPTHQRPALVALRALWRSRVTP